MNLRDRVRALERGRCPGEIETITIIGGLPLEEEASPDAPPRAQVAGQMIEREPNEPAASFDARVFALARAANVRSIVFGGLPE